MMGLIMLVGFFQSWNMALSIFNLCLISAVMTMGANIQWGYAGLINFGIMGYTALGGLAAVLISVDPVEEAWRAGGFDILMCFWFIVVMILVVRFILKNYAKSKIRTYSVAAIIILGIIIIRVTAEPGIEAIEAVDPATTGFLGGFGLPIIFSWIVGALFAGGLALVVGKVALGLRSDYLAIATLLISEIVIAIIKHEDWLTRGVKNVIGLKRPAPYEVDLQTTQWFINLVEKFNSGKLNVISDIAERQSVLNQLVIEGSSVFVKLCYSGLFLIVVVFLLILTQKALYSPWGRMMRAIRDNEEAANAMGKNVVKQHLFIFILGSAIVGIAGAMLVTQDGLFTPGSYRPMRYTFLIWVMVIVGGSGNNFGAILGGFVVWFLWIEAAPIALFLINLFTSGLSETHALKVHLIESVPYFRYLMMGMGLLLIMRYRPKGILPEKIEIK
ncbi:MAG: branched-chain amino acid ABC transporter permease [Pelagibacteraceae bacterium BACL5 MAG-121128-bin54]|uniref:branched-chain amino acid ABC transporter permease n=1 Tax=Candidatus Pelagibacter sp. TaxID=2024849 RepID=UPI000715254D|nr:MAG: branched-chain amino acid ABC transporter permease [Pelagibacteraceae bacterium BACL5 MAG-121128-bin54]